MLSHDQLTALTEGNQEMLDAYAEGLKAGHSYYDSFGSRSVTPTEPVNPYDGAKGLVWNEGREHGEADAHSAHFS